MCDDLTVLAEDRALARMGISRRDFGLAGGATVLWAGMVAAAEASQGPGGAPALAESMVTIATADGSADAFFVHPGRGRHPAVLLWPDIAGLREAYKIMARRLAQAGFAVLAVNHYYRSAPAPVMSGFAEWRTPEGQAKLKPMIAAINPARTSADAVAFTGWLDRQAAVDTRRKIGTVGFCMGGPYTVRTAAAVPARVGAAASMHGGGLVGAAPDSPVRLIARTNASFFFAIGRNDDAGAPGDKDALRAAADAAHRPAVIVVYNADHGWTTIDTPMYDHAEAEKAWARMLALFAKL